MMTFTDFRQQAEAAPDSDNTLTESRSLIRKGAAVAFTAQSRTHAKNAQSSLQQSLTALQSIQSKTTDEKIDAVSTALQSISTAMIEITKQLNQTTAVSASSALMNERTDEEILSLLNHKKKSRRRRR